MGIFGMGDRNFTHAFDGFAKLHSFKFNGGSDKVQFSAQFLNTQFYQDSSEFGKLAPFLVLNSVQPSYGLVDKMKALYNGIDNTNINVVKFGGQSFHTLSDYWHSYEINPKTLETLQRVNPPLSNANFIHRLAPIPAASHPVREVGTDNYINFYSLVNPIPFASHSLNVVRIKSATETELIASIPVKNLPYMHSLAATEDYAIVVAHPVYINWMTIVLYQDPLESLEYHANQPTDLYVVKLSTGEVTHLQCDGFFFMHNINSFQEGGKIFIDETSYNDISLMHVMSFSNIRAQTPIWPKAIKSQIKRLTIDLAANKATVSNFQAVPGLEFVNGLDMPVINPNYAHKRYCFIYGQVLGDRGMEEVSLVKKDICHGGTGDKVWKKENHYPSESWFHPNPHGTEEDDGIVFNIVLDGDSATSYILFLDGKTFEEINKAQLPTWIPFSLHGNFFPETCSEEDQQCS